MKKEIYNYTAIFEPAEEGGFVAYVPILPGCVTQGESFEETKEMVKKAIRGYLEVAKESGKSAPVESGEVVISKVQVNT